jgi:MFS superfamily sulfate permease-like transporter
MQKSSALTEVMASFVVFLVALPLCMGIAIASGVSPEKGIITGIIGGLCIGPIAGSPLQVSGPAAGLVVIVWQVVEQFGILGLGVCVAFAGALQLIAGLLGAGQIFRAVSPTVIYGMLSGIGVLIFGSQFHVMLDAVPLASGLKNLADIPHAMLEALLPPTGSIPDAAIVGIITISLVIVWDKVKRGPAAFIPGALIGVFGGSLVAALAALDVKLVQIPASLFDSIQFATTDQFITLLASPGFLVLAISVAIVASAETLLCAAAVDKLHTGERTNYNRELIAQGIGNTLCGVLGALPMTGVIVRSSANVRAGATTRWSATLHGVWLLAFVLILPQVLQYIPTSSLAALLVVIGWKLINFPILRELYQRGREEVGIFLLTVFSIVIFDLLTGIIVGFAATLLQLIYRLTHLEAHFFPSEEGGKELNLELEGAATFLRIPYLAKILNNIPADAILHVHLHHLAYIDHACLELLTQWGDQHEKSGGKVYLEWDQLHHYANSTKPISRRNERGSLGEQGEISLMNKT